MEKIMAEHRNIIDRVIGLEEKREFREFENRAQKLGENYYEDYKELKKYIWYSGATKWTNFKFIFEQILDLLEQAKDQKKQVTDLIGPDVASFIDEMVDNHNTWEQKQKDKLNKGVKNGFR
jgi:DNA-binding ferritin-like protein (Dps family)